MFVVFIFALELSPNTNTKCATKGWPISCSSLLDVLLHWRILPGMVFEEFAPFTRRVADLLDDDDLAQVQVLLLARPDAGKVIPKSGGLRKLRVAAKGHGKRGGARMIYYWVVARDRILEIGRASCREMV